jgi:hypothetical protein
MKPLLDRIPRTVFTAPYIHSLLYLVNGRLTDEDIGVVGLGVFISDSTCRRTRDTIPFAGNTDTSE